MEQKDVPCKKHILVCTNERGHGACCAAKDSMRLVHALKFAVEEKRFKDVVRVNKTGCLGRCALGANIMVYPDGVWLQQVTSADIPSLVKKHIMPFAQSGR